MRADPLRRSDRASRVLGLRGRCRCAQSRGRRPAPERHLRCGVGEGQARPSDRAGWSTPAAARGVRAVLHADGVGLNPSRRACIKGRVTSRSRPRPWRVSPRHPENDAREHALADRRPGNRGRERRHRLAVPGGGSDQDQARQRDGVRPPNASPVPHPRRGAVPHPQSQRRRRVQSGVEGHGARAHGRNRGHPLGCVEPGPLDGALSHRRTSRERDDVQLHC
jgi:hypothetical protein